MEIKKHRQWPVIDIVDIKCDVNEIERALKKVDSDYEFLDQVNIKTPHGSFTINRKSSSGRVYLWREKNSELDNKESWMDDYPQKFEQMTQRILGYLEK